MDVYLIEDDDLLEQFGIQSALILTKNLIANVPTIKKN